MTEETRVVTCAQEAWCNDDPNALRLFRGILSEFLDIRQSCPATAFDEVLNVLRSDKLAMTSEYGDLLTDLAISDFAFSTDQAFSLVKNIEAMFPRIDQPVARAQACHLLFAFQHLEAFARQLLRMLRKAQLEETPIAELVWELAPLLKEASLSEVVKEAIKQVLPRDSQNEAR